MTAKFKKMQKNVNSCRQNKGNERFLNFFPSYFRLIIMDKNTKPVPKGKYAQLTLDFPFKKTFATEGDEDLLIALLNAFLERKLKHPITEAVIQNPYIKGLTKADREAILDIRCRDSMGNCFIVEMQIGRQEYFIKRVIYYLSMAISNNGKKGKDWDFNFPNVYSLSFLNYDLYFGKDNDDVVQYLSLQRGISSNKVRLYESCVCEAR